MIKTYTYLIKVLKYLLLLFYKRFIKKGVLLNIILLNNKIYLNKMIIFYCRKYTYIINLDCIKNFMIN